MKISVIIITILIGQVTASFFDVFQGAVQSVQNSFGKLVTDVVTDVRDTVDCTILAVEHVLSLSDDATARYYKKCGNVNKTDPVSDAQQGGSLPKVEVSLEFSNNEEYLQKEIPAEIDAKINETLSKVLGSYKPHDNIMGIESVLAKESEQLADVNKLVKQELNKLSNEVNTDNEIMTKKDPQPSVDTILQEIRVLENKEQNTKNSSEATEIHQVIDEVLGKLDAIEGTEATENIKLEEILSDLEKNTNNSFIGLRQQFEEWKKEESRHLGQIKNKIEEHEENAKLSNNIYNNHISNYKHPVQFNSEMLNSFKPQDIKGNSLNTHKNAVNESTQLNSQIKEDVTTTKVKDSSEVSSNLNINEPTTTATTKDHMLIDTAITNTSSYKPESTFLSARENMNASRYIEPPTSTKLSNTVPNEAKEDISPHENDTTTLKRTSPRVENTLTITVLNTLNESNSDETVTRKALQITESPPVGEVIQLNHNIDLNKEELSSTPKKITVLDKTSTGSGEADSELTVTTEYSSNNDKRNDSVIISTPTPTLKTTVQVERPSHKEFSNFNEIKATAPQMLNKNDLNNTIPLLSTEDKIPVTNNKTAPKNEKFSLVTTNEYGSEHTTITTTLSPIVPSTSTSETIKTIEAITVSANANVLPVSNLTNSVIANYDLITNTPLAIIVNSPITDIIHLAEITTFSTVEASLTTPQPVHILNIETIANSSDIAITSTSEKKIESKFESDINKPVENTTVAKNVNESITSTIHRTAKNISNMSLSTYETSPISEITPSIKITTPIKNEEPTEPSLSTTQPADIPHKIIKYKNDQNGTVMPTSTISEGALANDNKATVVDNSTNFESQELLNSTEGPTTTTHTVIKLTETTPISKIITTDKATANAGDRSLSNFATNSILTAPIFNSYGLKHVMPNSPTYAITENPLLKKRTQSYYGLRNPANRAWLPPTQHEMSLNKFNQNQYMNGVPKLNYALNDPKSMSGQGPHLRPDSPKAEVIRPTRMLNHNPYSTDRMHTNYHNARETLYSMRTPMGIPLAITKVPLSDTSGLLRNKYPKTYTPDRFSPSNMHNLQPNFKTENEKQKAVHEILDSVKTLINSNSPPPYSSNERVLNTYRPLRGLTTYRPRTTVARGINNADYDSFFHIPQKNTDAHQRALREAKELIENSKRSHRILDSILKNKNNYGTRSIFNNPGILNSGK